MWIHKWLMLSPVFARHVRKWTPDSAHTHLAILMLIGSVSLTDWLSVCSGFFILIWSASTLSRIMPFFPSIKFNVIRPYLYCFFFIVGSYDHFLSLSHPSISISRSPKSMTNIVWSTAIDSYYNVFMNPKPNLLRVSLVLGTAKLHSRTPRIQIKLTLNQN